MKKNFRVFKNIIAGVAAFLVAFTPIYSAIYVNNKVSASEQSDVQADSYYKIPVAITLDYEKAFALVKKVEDEKKLMDKNLLDQAMDDIKAGLKDIVSMNEDDILAEIAKEDVKSYGIGAITVNGKTIYKVITSTDEAIEEAMQPENEDDIVEIEYAANEFEIATSETEITVKEEAEKEFEISVNDQVIRPTYFESEDNETATVSVIEKRIVVKGVKTGETNVKVGLLGENGNKKFASVKVTVEKKSDVTPTPDQEDEPERPAATQEQTPLTFNNSLSVLVGDELVLKVEGGSGDGSLSYKMEDAFGAATLSGDILKAHKTGNVRIIAMKAASGSYKAATASINIFIIAKSSADAGPVDHVIVKNDTKPIKVLPSQSNGGLGTNVENVETGATEEEAAGEISDAGNHVSPITEEEIAAANEEYDASWTVWLWFLIPIITLMVMVILFARNRIR